MTDRTPLEQVLARTIDERQALRAAFEERPASPAERARARNLVMSGDDQLVRPFAEELRRPWDRYHGR